MVVPGCLLSTPVRPTFKKQLIMVRITPASSPHWDGGSDRQRDASGVAEWGRAVG